ncbi:MAG: T9SS type A sorting domain-containing protein [Bacteroidales bacterium]
MKRNFWIIGSTLLLAVVAGLVLVNVNGKKDARAQYEQFLASEYAGYSGHQSGQEAIKPDKPDVAAFAEYIKTLDPQIKAVPRERIVDAHRLTEAAARLKSAPNALAWAHHTTDMGGRTRALVFDPNDPEKVKMWAGAVTGGLWYNNNPMAGEPWQPVDDFWPNLSISSITWDPNNTQTLYVGTGESETALIIYRESSGLGTGIIRSTDGGQTWDIMPSTRNWAYVNDILVRDEGGQSVIYAAVASGVYKGKAHRTTPGDGLYRSTDGGETWTQVLPNIPGKEYSYVPSDIETSADGARIFIGTTYGVNESATDNDRSGAACILVSEDGLNWTVNNTYQQRILLDPANQYPGRVMLSRAPSNANIVYAIIASGYVRSDQFIGYGCQFLVKSTDKGETWNEIGFPAGFASLAWHAFVISVNPVNPNVIWVGGLDTHRTVDGGNTWVRMSNWAEMYGTGSPKYVHADIHVILYRPGNDSEMYVATDGGVFGTRSASSPDNVIFFELNQNYSTLQYYSCAMHPDAGSIHFIGGLQDNGTMFYRKGKTPVFTDMLSGGDGALCFIDENEPELQITTVYHNSFYLWTGEKEVKPSRVNVRSLSTGLFVNPMDYDWKNNRIFANGCNEQGNYQNTLHMLTVSATGVTGGTPARTLNTQTGLPYSNIKWSEHSAPNQSNIIIGTQAGKIFKLVNASGAGTLTELTPSTFPTANISGIDIGASEDTLLVTFSNYGVASVWLSVNGGSTWKDVESNLPDMPVRWGIFHPRTSKQAMLATETGIWTTDNILANNVIWTPDNSGLANVRIDMVKVRKSDNTVLAATHGRGMFTAVWEPSFTSGIPNTDTGNSTLVVYPNPSDGRFEVRFAHPGRTQVTVTDLTGRVVLEEVFVQGPASTARTYNLTSQPKGTYILRVDHPAGTETSKILIHR